MNCFPLTVSKRVICWNMATLKPSGQNHCGLFLRSALSVLHIFRLPYPYQHQNCNPTAFTSQNKVTPTCRVDEDLLKCYLTKKKSNNGPMLCQQICFNLTKHKFVQGRLQCQRCLQTRRGWVTKGIVLKLRHIHIRCYLNTSPQICDFSSCHLTCDSCGCEASVLVTLQPNHKSLQPDKNHSIK